MDSANATHVLTCMELNQVPNFVDQQCGVVGDMVYTPIHQPVYCIWASIDEDTVT